MGSSPEGEWGTVYIIMTELWSGGGQIDIEKAREVVMRL
jgi:hypothetical protein